MKQTRVCVDTSVIGGCFDKEFAKESLALAQAARDGPICAAALGPLGDELRGAAPEKQAVVAALPAGAFEAVLRNDETARLRDAYLLAKVVGPQHAVDAHHIALATVWWADLVVSWNFKHIVHWDKIRGFNAVNMREGYRSIEIRSPREVF